VKRIWRIRDDKTALTQLHNKGLVGDDTMDRFAAAEKELEAEIVDVVQEANSFRMGWGQGIFGTATEMAHAERGREVVLTIPKLKAAEGESGVWSRSFVSFRHVHDPSCMGMAECGMDDRCVREILP
jgi:translocation protein SEC66